MFKFIRDYFRTRTLTRAFKQVAEEKFATGEIDVPTYAKWMNAAHDKPTMKAAYNQMKNDDNMLGGIRDWDWEAILNWVRENLIPMLKIALPLILLLDDEK